MKKEREVINDKLKKSMAEQETKEELVTDKIVEQLIVSEDRQRGKVTLDVYMSYVRNSGGAIFILSIIFSMSAWTVLSILSNIQI